MAIKVISHRGANRYAPQNTLPAFKKSLAIGVDGFETDIHVTLDGIPVVCHNYTIDETSDGNGLIAEKTLDELKTYDFGSYFGEEFKGTRMPTLEEFLTLCETADIELMNIELKSPQQGETGIVEKTIAAVKAHGLFDKLIISSFDSRLLVEAKKIDKNCPTGYLYCINGFDNPMALTVPAAYAASLGCDALHPHYAHVTRRYVTLAHRRGIKVNVWTVDDPVIIRRMIACGVDGIITNCPDVVKAELAKKNL